MATPHTVVVRLRASVDVAGLLPARPDAAPVPPSLKAILDGYPGASAGPLVRGGASLRPTPPTAALWAARYVRVRASSDAEAREIAARVLASPDVELAYVEPVYSPPIAFRIERPHVTPPSAFTPDFTMRQAHLGPAPGGIDARYAWSLGAAGEGITLADVEGGWILDHEEFDPARIALSHGEQSTDEEWVQHGTACVGEAFARRDAPGVAGIAHAVRFVHCCSWMGEENGVPNAIAQASAHLSAGDVMLIEPQANGPTGVPIAIEYWEANLDAIRSATDRGIVVVEAAGNGGANLDDPAFAGKFDRRIADSGAILVGAGASPASGQDRARLDFSNYGARLDLQGYGVDVCTTGYGDLHGPERRKYYTGSFNGTSSASPMVWAASAILQGIARRRGRVLTAAQVRETLVATGSPQQDGPGRPATQRIGPRPDLRAAIARLQEVFA
jgi:hypothetical protein